MGKREQILFSCVGTSDPLRGWRDGPLMHIARHYRPEKICLFVSKEMENYIPYNEQALKAVRDSWNYAPEISTIKSGITDPSNLDGLYEPMGEAFEGFASRYPGAEVLINLTSGTSQMEIILSQLALSVAGRGFGIQVKNPEHQAGTKERVNSPRYNLQEELEHNLDEEPGAENRCVVPKLFAIRRERQWREIQTLLERRDYTAILDRAAILKGEEFFLSPQLLEIVRHLNARELLQGEEARAIAAQWPEEIRKAVNPYPRKAGTDFSGQFSDEEEAGYWRVVDYWLMMKSMLKTGRYSDFLLRLSILALHLEEAEIKSLLAGQGLSYEALSYPLPGYEQDRVLSMQDKRTLFLEGSG